MQSPHYNIPIAAKPFLLNIPPGYDIEHHGTTQGVTGLCHALKYLSADNE